MCRTLSYYVDPGSSEIIELGTRQYPYKNIALPFIEILNFHSHTDRVVSIYLKEYTTSYMMQTTNYIINMTMVKIQSYTDGVNEAANANLFGVDYDIQIFSPATVMNLIVDDTLKLNETIDAADGLSTNEVLKLSTTDSNIYLLRTTLYMDKVNMYRNINADNQKQTNFIRAIYLQEKNVTMMNCQIQVTGFILLTEDPMSLFIENLYIDYHASMGGYVMRTLCNYPEAYLLGKVMLSNVTVENPQERISPMREGFIYNIGPENMTVINSTVLMWSSLTEDRGNIEKQQIGTCVPDDDLVQQVEVINTYWSLTYNPTQDRFVLFYSTFTPDYIRKIVIKYENNLHENIVDNVYAVCHMNANVNTDMEVRNNIFTNVSSKNGAVFSDYSQNIIVENEIYRDSENFGFSTYSFFFAVNVTFINFTNSNLNGTGTSDNHYIYLSMLSGSQVNLNQIFYENSNIGVQSGLSIVGTIDSLTITDSVFSNLTIGTSNSLLSTGKIRSLLISNITFININSVTPDDQNNFMINVDSINLDNASNSSIGNITVLNSQTSFVKFDTITGNNATTKYFEITGIRYKDCHIETSRDLIKFGNLESQQDIKFIIDDFQYTNMTFDDQSNLFLFQQQLLNQIVIKNSLFSSIRSGVILVEAANKQTLEVETKVKFENTTFVDVAANFGSLLLINEGGNVEISDCSFSNIYCLEEGAVIFAGYQRTTTTIHRSQFTNCTSVQGGVFNVESESKIAIYDTAIFNNFAVISGVIQASNNGYFKLQN